MILSGFQEFKHDLLHKEEKNSGGRAPRKEDIVAMLLIALNVLLEMEGVRRRKQSPITALPFLFMQLPNHSPQTISPLKIGRYHSIHGPVSSLLDSCYCAGYLFSCEELKLPVAQSGHGTDRAELVFPDRNGGFKV